MTQRHRIYNLLHKAKNPGTFSRLRDFFYPVQPVIRTDDKYFLPDTDVFSGPDWLLIRYWSQPK